MESLLYHQLFSYLNTLVFEPTTSPSQRKKLRKLAKRFFIQNSLLFRKRKNESPQRIVKDTEKSQLLQEMHEDPTSGHLGIVNTFNRIHDRYFWDGMYKDIQDFVKSCNTYQRFGKEKAHESLYPILIGSPFEQVGIDVVGPLTVTESGKRYIVTATDYLTKWTEARAVEQADAGTIGKFIFEEIIYHHGCPKKLITDQGTEFLNQLVAALTKEFGIKQVITTAYHPRPMD